MKLGIGLWFAVTLLGCSGEDRQPNVVLISLDTVRADHLSFYGYGRETSPALARLAATGVVFENAYSQAPNTVPTHASMFTGRFPFEHQMYGYGWKLEDTETTLSEMLGAAGYRTYALTSSVRFESSAGYDQGFDIYETHHHLDKNARSERVTARALELARSESDAPFFAFLHYFDAHGPYAVPSPYRERWHAGMQGLRPEDTVEFMSERRLPGVSVSREVLEYLAALYDAGIAYQDTHLDALFEGLETAPNLRSTLWIVTSDHGEEFKEHGVLMHSHYLHEELLRVPLVIRYPERIKAGQRIATPIQTVDLVPTILELARIGPSTRASGRSFTSSIVGERKSEGLQVLTANDVIVVEALPSWGVIGTLKTGRFKWVSGRESGLYHLDVDPSANRDVASEYPDERAQLIDVAHALGLTAAIEEVQRRKPATEPDERIREQLRAIGYVEEVEALQ